MAEQIIASLREELERAKENQQAYRLRLKALDTTRGKITDQIQALAKDYQRRAKVAEVKADSIRIANESLTKENVLFKSEIESYQKRLVEKEKLIAMLLSQRKDHAEYARSEREQSSIVDQFRTDQLFRKNTQPREDVEVGPNRQDTVSSRQQIGSSKQETATGKQDTATGKQQTPQSTATVAENLEQSQDIQKAIQNIKGYSEGTAKRIAAVKSPMKVLPEIVSEQPLQPIVRQAIPLPPARKRVNPPPLPKQLLRNSHEDNVETSLLNTNTFSQVLSPNVNPSFMHQSHETQELPTEATPESQQEADVEESQDDAESKQPLEQDEKMAEQDDRGPSEDFLQSFNPSKGPSTIKKKADKDKLFPSNRSILTHFEADPEQVQSPRDFFNQLSRKDSQPRLQIEESSIDHLDRDTSMTSNEPMNSYFDSGVTRTPPVKMHKKKTKRDNIKGIDPSLFG